MSNAPRFTPQDFARDDIGHGTHAIDDRGHVHGFDPSIRDVLIERGLLVLDRDGVWRLRGDDFPDLRPDQPLGYLAVCDFCGQRPAPWVIPCEDFFLPAVGNGRVPVGKSEGDWAACDTCGGHIATRNKYAFLVHCIKAHDHPEQPRELRREMKKSQQRLHARFWIHYRGGAVRGTPRPFGH